MASSENVSALGLGPLHSVVSLVAWIFFTILKRTAKERARKLKAHLDKLQAELEEAELESTSSEAESFETNLRSEDFYGTPPWRISPTPEDVLEEGPVLPRCVSRRGPS